MDSLRVSDDYGKFKFQFALGYPLVGMKGSYVIVKNCVEKVIGFDHGLNSSITEDAFFAMDAWQKGYSFKFIKGNMFERSPLSLWDLSMQRSRWYYGLMLLCFDCQINCRYKIILSLLMLTWTTIFLSVLGFFWNVMFNLDKSHLEILLVLGIVWGMSIAVYNIGFYHNFNHRNNGFCRTLGLYLLMILFVIGVIVGIMKVIKHMCCCCICPTISFNVVKKSLSFSVNSTNSLPKSNSPEKNNSLSSRRSSSSSKRSSENYQKKSDMDMEECSLRESYELEEQENQSSVRTNTEDMNQLDTINEDTFSSIMNVNSSGSFRKSTSPDTHTRHCKIIVPDDE